MFSPRSNSTPWWRLLNGYHWFVFGLAAFGWLFDTMDQQIFVVSKSLTMAEFFPTSDAQLAHGTSSVMIFIFGWATGGLFFGMMGDKWGRAKTMAVTIFVYAIFTGLSGLAHSYEVFVFCRFLTGLGVGGEFAVGAALVAEVMPEKARSHALGILQALSAVGNIMGASLLRVVAGHPAWSWRQLYFFGAGPALLAVFVFWRLKEPERWVLAKQRAGATASQFGKISELFTVAQWRRNTIVGLTLAIAGVVGVWGVGFWSPELIKSVIPPLPIESKAKFESALQGNSNDGAKAIYQSFTDKEKTSWENIRHQSRAPVNGDPWMVDPDIRERMTRLVTHSKPAIELNRLISDASVMQQIGAFFGMFAFTILASRLGRRLSFLIAFAFAWLSVLVTFYTFQNEGQIWYLWPLLGFGTLAPFGGFAIYLPELYPTRLRTTGTGFCYNVGRYLSAFGPLMLGKLALQFEGKFTIPGFRLAAIVVASAYFLGMFVLIWAPETVNKPLPEDERSFAH